MAKSSNKHKSQGRPAKVVKESWWTPQRVKAAIAVAVLAAVVIIGVCVYNYVSGLQDSVVGSWSNQFESSSTGETVEVVFTFNEDTTCGFVRYREGVEEASMDGVYSIDDNYDIITVMLGEDYSTVMQYYYDCDGDDLEFKNFSTGEVDNYVKVEKAVTAIEGAETTEDTEATE